MPDCVVNVGNRMEAVYVQDVVMGPSKVRYVWNIKCITVVFAYDCMIIARNCAYMEADVLRVQ